MIFLYSTLKNFYKLELRESKGRIPSVNHASTMTISNHSYPRGEGTESNARISLLCPPDLRRNRIIETFLR